MARPPPRRLPSLLLAAGRGRAGPRLQQRCLLCARLVEVREALTQVRRKQALQDSERKGAEQETSLRWAPREAVSGPDEWSWGCPMAG